jgi:hypothetical protein
MFLKSHTELAVEFDVVRHVLVECPGPVLAAAALEVQPYGERLLDEVGLRTLLGTPASRPFVHVGDAIANERMASLPFQLRVEENGTLLRSLEGSVDAAWLGPGRTHLALSAQYEVPVAAVGSIVDRALLHRVVEAATQRFVESAARHLVDL